MNALDILRLVTQSLATANIAIPIIATTIQLIANRLDPSLTPAQVIDLLEQELTKNHERKLQLVEEIRATMVGGETPPVPAPEG